MALTCSIFSKSENTFVHARIRSIRAVRPSLLALAALFLASAPAYGDSHLLYFEAQGIAGHSSLQSKAIYYSMNPDAEMQKPSVGFDYLHRFSGETGDWGSFGLQGRLAFSVYEDGATKVEPQAYNAWFKVKTPWTDAWIGHNRPALGLGSYFDSHPLILRTLPIQGFGYDRDWGVGTYRDFSWGNLQLSATTGSGMPIYFKGNYLLAGRVAYGVLNEDNYTAGFSLGYGRTLDTMGYELRDSTPRGMRLLGTDFAFLRDNLEHRFDLFTGKWLDADTVALMYRLGYLFGPEERLKIEVQPTYWNFWKSGDENWLMSVCFSALVTSDITFRTMYEFNRTETDHRVIAQLYFYKPL